MFLEFSKFYFIKSTLKKLPKLVLDSFSYNDELLLNLASYNTLPAYFRILNPFIKDRYSLKDKLMDDDKFNEFILECLYIVKKEDKLDRLLFFYALILNHVYDKYMIEYLNAIKDDSLSINRCMNMVDFYLANREDEIDLSKINIYKKYPDAFKPLAYTDEVMHQPLLKVYNQFSSQTLFTKAIKRRHFIYRFMIKPSWYNKAILYTHDFIFRIKKDYRLKDIPYYNKIDTKILNLSHNEYEIDGIKYNFSLDDIIKAAKIDGLNKITAVNEYIFNKHEKLLRKEFKIKENINLSE